MGELQQDIKQRMFRKDTAVLSVDPEVWNQNLQEVLDKIEDMKKEYPKITVETNVFVNNREPFNVVRDNIAAANWFIKWFGEQQDG